jgi:hypothetical protein
LIEISKRIVNTGAFYEYRDKPVEFVREIIGAEPEPYQAKVLEAIAKHNKVGWRSGHGVGKTTALAWAAIWFLFTRQSSKVITTASVWRQVEKILWSEIAKWIGRARVNLLSRIPYYELLKTQLTIAPDWFATGESSDDPDKIEGFHAESILYIVDEGKSVPDKTYEAIEGALTTKEAKLVVASTPPPQKAGYFWKIFSKRIPGFVTFHTSCLESPRVSKAWIEDKKKQWGEDSPIYQTRVLGEFPDITEDMLIPLKLIEDAIERILTEGEQRELGIDVARFGSDKTVFTIRFGSKVALIEKTAKEDTMETAGKGANFIKQYNLSKTKVDVIGIGAGVYDKISEDFGENAVPINVGERSNDVEKYSNLRAQIFWELRERFLEGDIDLPDDEELTGQLSNIKYKFNSKGQLVIESKQDMKKRGLTSPDCADSLALCFYSPVTEFPSDTVESEHEDEWYKEESPFNA